MSKLSPDKMLFREVDATADTGAGGEPDTSPDYEEVVEVDPDEADALVDEGISAAA